jgi:two-component system, chemotaxis family, protein-glutamate methylesterase/glutaminase
LKPSWKVLIAEDDRTSALLLERALGRAGHEPVVVQDGQEALSRLMSGGFDAVITDWMMPRMDGIELVRRARLDVAKPPVFLVVTALTSAEARMHALRAGADDYVAKPFSVRDILDRLENCMARQQQPEPVTPAIAPAATLMAVPPHVAICITASTGGPEAVREVVLGCGMLESACIFLVLHGPAWMLETFVGRLQKDTGMKVQLAQDGLESRSGFIYIAPGDRHLTVSEGDFRMHLRMDPPENYMRPAADPLFRSAAKAFGKYCIAAVLTGMGRDGTLGAATIAASGGIVLAQDPRTAVAASMPQTVINIGAATSVVPLDSLGANLREHVLSLSRELIH